MNNLLTDSISSTIKRKLTLALISIFLSDSFAICLASFPNTKDSIPKTIDILANDIAKNCRRGAGNTVMYHPKLASIVENSRNLSNFFYSTYKFIENEHCPEDYIVVLYQGSEQTDQPFVYTDEDDELHLFSNNLGKDVTNYGQKVKIIT